jgi:hypothetical protein
MGWDLFFKKPSRNWSRESASKSGPAKQAQRTAQPPQPRMPTSIKELRALKNSKPPKLTGTISDRTGPSHFKPSLPFNIRVPVFTRGDLIGGTFVGDEERELARYGGSAEREALGRRLGKRTGSMGEHIHDADLDEDDSNSQPQGNKSQSPLLKATKGTGEVLSKGATTASQVVAVAQIASYAGRLGKKKR